MFMLYAILIGIGLGILCGGTPAGLGRLSLRWGWLAVAGLGVQVLLFAPPIAERIGELGPPIYVASTMLVLGVVLRNLRRLPGLALVATGAAANLLAIVTNGGYMPASGAALAAAGRTDPAGYSNGTLLAHPALEPLIDRFALPSWVPFTNVFSLGDVVIAVGVALVIITAMRVRAQAA